MANKDLKQNRLYGPNIEAAIVYFSKILTEVVRKIHKEHDFEASLEEFHVLEVIHLFPGIIQADIAKKSLIRCSYVCKLLTGLEEKGFIRKEKKIKGKKQVTYENFLTEAGEELYKKIHSCAVDESRKIFEGRESDIEDFINKLYNMADYLKETYKINF